MLRITMGCNNLQCTKQRHLLEQSLFASLRGRNLFHWALASIVDYLVGPERGELRQARDGLLLGADVGCRGLRRSVVGTPSLPANAVESPVGEVTGVLLQVPNAVPSSLHIEIVDEGLGGPLVVTKTLDFSVRLEDMQEISARYFDG